MNRSNLSVSIGKIADHLKPIKIHPRMINT
jgi:hypothetical protein